MSAGNIQQSSLALTDSCGNNGNSGLSRLLLVSSALKDHEILEQAARPSVVVTPYEAGNTTLGELLQLARTSLGGRQVESIGIVTHDYGEAKFHLAGDQTVSLVSTLNSQQQRDFWKSLGSLLIEGGRIDLFPCKLAAGEIGELLVAELEKAAGVNVAASTDLTGNEMCGGDWILETDGVDLEEAYFDSADLALFATLLVTQDQKLIASDAADSDQMGHSISISGDLAIVGAPYADVGGQSYAGAAYVFRNVSGTWTQEAKLVDPTPSLGANFGRGVSISGNYAAVGAPSDQWQDIDPDSNRGGVVRIFLRDAGGSWSQVKHLSAPSISIGDYYGYSVCLDGDNLIVGAYGRFGPGTIHFYNRNQGGADTWGPVNDFTAPSGGSEAEFGFSVCIKGNYAVVGSRSADVGSDSNAGSASIYQLSGGVWSRMTTITAPDPGVDVFFGDAVAVDGSYVVVGAPRACESGGDDSKGAAYVFYNNSGTWEQVAKLTNQYPDNVGLSLGESVAISGNYVVVGGPYNSPDDCAYVYRNDSGTWSKIAQLLPSDDPTEGSNLGDAVAVTDSWVFVSSVFSDDGLSNNGAAYVYALNDPPVASGVSISGNSYIGTTLSANYTYSDDESDPEGSTTIEWHRADNASGGGSWYLTTGGSYTIPASLLGKYIQVRVTPKASSGWSPGAKVSSSWIGPVTYPPTAPSVSNAAPASVTNNSAVVGGDVTSDGGMPVNDRGIVWSTTVTSPTLATGTKLQIGSGTGAFSTTMGSLSPNTTYYYRAYATNAIGTSYGSGSQSFTTYADTYTISGTVSDGSNPLSGVTVTFSYSGSTETTVAGYYSHTVPYNTTTNVTPSKTGYHFTPASTSLSNINSNRTADFTGALDTFTISGTITDGVNPLVGVTLSSSPDVGTETTNASGNYSFTVTYGTSTTITPGKTAYTFTPPTRVFTSVAANQTQNFIATLITYAITVTQTANGTISPGTTSVVYDQNQAFDVTPDTNYHVTSVTVDGSAVALDGSKITDNGDGSFTYTFENVLATHTITAAYERDKGSLQVTTVPDTGQWRRVGTGTWNASGYTESDLDTGDYEVEFSDLPDYDKPGNVTISVERDTVATATGTYTRHVGSLKVMLAPVRAVMSGARWRIVGEPTWRTGGTTVASILTGTVEIEFLTIIGWNKPSNHAVQIVKDATTVSQDWYTPSASAVPVIHFFSAVPEVAANGDSFVLKWMVDNGEDVGIVGVATGLANQGQLVVKPANNTVYSLTASNYAGTATGTAAVRVIKKPRILWFNSCNPPGEPVNAGCASSLSWGIEGATKVTITRKGASADSAALVDCECGSLSVTPGKTAKYVLRAENAAGLVTAEAIVEVTCCPAIIGFSSSALSIVAGDKVTLSWQIDGEVENLSMSPAVNGSLKLKGGKGHITVKPDKTTVFKLTASNNFGNDNVSLKVKVVEAKASTDLSAIISSTNPPALSGNYLEGCVVPVDVMVENLGNATARKFDIRLLRGKVEVDRTTIRKLSADSSRLVTFNYIPIRPGVHKLVAEVDPDGMLPDPDRSNNLDKKAIKVGAVYGVDLVVSGIRVQKAPDGEKKGVITVSMTVTNVGNVAAGAFQYRVHVGQSAAIDKSTTFVNAHLEKLSAGESVVITENLVLGKKLMKQFYLTGLVEYYDALPESDESNNLLTTRYYWKNLP